MSDIFISYSGEDRGRVRVLAESLELLGWSIWWDRVIPAGTIFDDVIQEQLDGSKCIIVIWTKHSVASRWVRTEAEEGANRNILVPVIFEEVRIPLAFRPIQAAGLIDWNPETSHLGYDLLIKDLSRILGPAPGKNSDSIASEIEKNNISFSEAIEAELKIQLNILKEKECVIKEEGLPPVNISQPEPAVQKLLVETPFEQNKESSESSKKFTIPLKPSDNGYQNREPTKVSFPTMLFALCLIALVLVGLLFSAIQSRDNDHSNKPPTIQSEGSPISATNK